MSSRQITGAGESCKNIRSLRQLASTKSKTRAADSFWRPRQERALLAHVASAAQSSTADTDISEDGSDRDDEMGHAASLNASGDDADCDARSFIRASGAAKDDLDHRAAKWSQHHVKQGHLRKAAQVLYSTTTMADLAASETQSAITELHPPLPEGSVLPTLPVDSPHIILEDDEVISVHQSSAQT